MTDAPALCRSDTESIWAPVPRTLVVSRVGQTSTDGSFWTCTCVQLTRTWRHTVASSSSTASMALSRTGLRGASISSTCSPAVRSRRRRGGHSTPQPTREYGPRESIDNTGSGTRRPPRGGARATRRACLVRRGRPRGPAGNHRHAAGAGTALSITLPRRRCRRRASDVRRLRWRSLRRA